MDKSNLIHIIYTLLIICFSYKQSVAHEFWIEPEKFEVKNTEKISANIRVGQMMKGVSYGYYPKNFRRSEIKIDDIITPILGQPGDKPAINAPPQGDNLVTLIYTTKDNIVSYNDWSLFENFLIEKNLMSVKKEHLLKNFPKTKFKEMYSRYAKALIGSGKSFGEDHETGLEVEIILDKNPYTEDTSNGLEITLLNKGIPKPNSQIEIFSRSVDKSIRMETLLTDKFGKVVVKVSPKTDYLINAVIMRKPKDNKRDLRAVRQPILWESLWASTTFRVP